MVAYKSVTMCHSGSPNLSFSVGEEGVVIGRPGGEADIVLHWDLRASRDHARMWLEGEQLWIEDLSSMNGVWVNYERVDGRASVGDSDVLVIGATRMTVDGVPVASQVDVEVARVVTAPAPPPENMVAIQADECRFESANSVVFGVSDRGKLQAFWDADLSNGALFIPSDRDVQRGAELVVELRTPAGGLSLQATVVHVLDEKMAAATGQSAGVGLAFSDLNHGRKEAIEKYLEGDDAAFVNVPRSIAPSFGVEASPSASRTAPGPEAEAAIKRAADIYDTLKNADYYALLDVEPEAPAAIVTAAIERETALLTSGLADAPEIRRARIESALGILERVRRIMARPDRRLAYDFRVGHVRAEARLASKEHPVHVMREIWTQTFPDQIKEGNRVAVRALTAHREGKLGLAIKLATSALECDPFIEGLREKIALWTAAHENANSGAPRTAVRFTGGATTKKRSKSKAQRKKKGGFSLFAA